MEEDIRKQGMLHLQQQRFGKKWKRVWCVLFRESSCSISRLEFFECKDGGNAEKNDKCLRKQQEHKKVIRLTDCIRISELEMDGCPRDTGPFLVETTEKIYVFAADRAQLEDWTHKLCEIAFPMSWMEGGVKRGCLQRGHRMEGDEGSEDNSLYSGRETVRDFRVCVRRTEASERCRLRSDVVLRVDQSALKLLSPNGGVAYEWPYRYLRRFGRDKSTFSFEAGRRCDSGEGSFEFDTRQGNSLFQAVEAAINVQRISVPRRQTSGGGQGAPDCPQGLPPPLIQSRTLPLPQPRGHVPQSPAAAQALDGVYSVVTEPAHLHMIHHMDRESNPPFQQQQQQRPLLEAHLQLPVDKTLTGVKSLTLDAYSLAVPRKNQVKMISSCPLPHTGPEPGPAPAPTPTPRLSPNPNPNLNASADPSQTYSQITVSAAKRSIRREKRSDAAVSPPLIAKEPEYSLPFDTIANNLTDASLKCLQAPGGGAGVDPLYDSIDEMKIRNIFTGEAAGRVEHIYDEPEGCAAAAAAAAASVQKPAGASLVYDDPEEMRGDAWRIMGTAGDPRGHEYPYNPRLDDYAVPKRPQRACPAAQSTTEEEREHEGVQPRGEGEERHDSPYNNVTVKMA